MMSVMAKLMLDPGPKYELHVQVPWALRDQIWAKATAADLSPSQWIRQAIREKLAREDGK